jgi:hypothetical protein
MAFSFVSRSGVESIYRACLSRALIAIWCRSNEQDRGGGSELKTIKVEPRDCRHSCSLYLSNSCLVGTAYKAVKRDKMQEKRAPNDPLVGTVH